jgi:lysophospholipase L1-like esterase
MIYGNGMNLENKKILVSHGDSFTQGVGFKLVDGESIRINLEKPWPVFLSEKYNMECINFGKEGISNAGITRDLLYYFSTTKDNFEDLAVVVGWTNPSREEFYLREKNTWTTQNNFDEQKTMRDYVTYWKTLENDYRKTIMNKMVIQSYLKLHNIPYLFFDTFVHRFQEGHKTWNPSIKNDDNKSIMDVIGSNSYYPLGEFNDKLLDTEFYTEKIFWVEISNMDWSYSFLPDDGHPNEKGHEYWANYLKEVIDGNKN